MQTHSLKPVVRVHQGQPHTYLQWTLEITEIIAVCACLFAMTWKIWKYGDFEGIVFLVLSCLCLGVSYVLAEIHHEYKPAQIWLIVSMAVIAMGLLNLFSFVGSPQTMWVDVSQRKVSPFMANPFKDDILSVSKDQSFSNTITTRTVDGTTIACKIAVDGLTLDTKSGDWQSNLFDLAQFGSPDTSIEAQLANGYNDIVMNTLATMKLSQVMQQEKSGELIRRIETRAEDVPARQSLGLNASGVDVQVACKKPPY